MDVNKIIHEAMGLCWHVRSNEHRFGGPVCHKCGSLMQNNRNYTDPVHYCALMDWMQMRGKMRHSDFDDWIKDKNGCNEVSDWLWSPRQEQITLIAEAIEAGILAK